MKQHLFLATMLFLSVSPCNKIVSLPPLQLNAKESLNAITRFIDNGAIVQDKTV